MYTYPPTGNQHPIYLWVAGEVTENQQRVEQAALFPLGPSSTYSVTMQRCELPRPGKHLRLRAYNVTGVQRQKKKRPKLRTDQSSRKNTTKQQRDSQPIRYTVQNTGYQDAPGTHWVFQQHKKDRGSNEGPIM